MIGQSLLDRARRPGFARSALTLVSGTVATQVLTAFSAPALARLYSPAGYGLIGLFMLVTTLGGVVATLQYSRAILLPADVEDGRALLHLCVWLTTAISAVVAVPSVLLAEPFAQALSAPSLAGWFPFIPLALWISGVSTAVNAYCNRLGLYAAMSSSRVVGVVVSVAVSLIVGLMTRSAVGLLVGYLASLIATFGVLVHAIWKTERGTLFGVEPGHVIGLARRYRKFALLTTPTELANNFVNQIPLLLLTTLVGPAAVGLFNMTNRLLGLPNVFIAGAVGEVFQQRAASDYASTGSCRPIYTKTARTLALAGVVPMVVLVLFAPDLFALYLGAEWRAAGEFARILSGLYFLRLVVSPLSYVFFIAERQQEDLAAHVAMVALVAGGMYAAHLTGGGVDGMIAAYATAYGLTYVYYFARGYALTMRSAAPALTPTLTPRG